MTHFRFALPLLAAMLFSAALKAEETTTDAPKVDDAKPTETKPADAPKTDGELPKAPDGTSTLAASHANESLAGVIGKAKPKDKAEKKAAKKGGGLDTFTLHVAGSKIKGDKEAKKGRTVTLTASGDVLAQLKAFAETKAHIKVTGDLNGDTMTVKEVSETPADKKKKNKNNV
ncbi:MAG TPA: hypothetical protein VKX17_03725 [Planctomycetota bacterium]|nr:hypothetical protein [Planctomycetota bacterium]